MHSKKHILKLEKVHTGKTSQDGMHSQQCQKAHPQNSSDGLLTTYKHPGCLQMHLMD